MANTPARGYPLQVTGTNINTWGAVVNSEVFTVIDENIGGVETIAISGTGSTNITTSQESNMTLRFTGVLTGAYTIYLPSGPSSPHLIDNRTTGTNDLVIQVSGSSVPAIACPQGFITQVSSDGTDVLEVSGEILPTATDSQLYGGTGNPNSAAIVNVGTGLSLIAGTLAAVATGNIQLSQQVLSSTATYTPTSGTTFVIVFITGGGGGGQSGVVYSGGAAGETAIGVFTAAQIGASQSVTVASSAASDANGTTTSFGALLTAVGGPVGSSGGAKGGSGGTGTGLHIPGGDGEQGPSYTSSPYLGGMGGASFWGGGGQGGLSANSYSSGSPGRAYGSGGGGYAGNTGSAGAGAPGICLVFEFGG